MKTLQIVSSQMSFFQEQVRILERMGVDCDVVSFENTHSAKSTLPARVLNRIYGHNPAYYGYRAAKFYPKILYGSIGSNYDLVHLNSGTIAPLGLLQPNRPLILTLWGDDLLGDRLSGMQSSMSKFCAKRCSRVIVRSEEMRNALPCDAQIIPSGVDTEKFSPINQERARKRVGWDFDHKHVLFPYPQWQKKKRYSFARTLIESVNQAFESTVELQDVYGVPHDEMPYYYNAADALILPSRREGSPNTVKEAMACNVPVVASNVGDVRERLSPVTNSYVCEDDEEFEQALISVLNSDSRSDGRKHTDEVSLEHMGERIVSVYEAVLDERHATSKKPSSTGGVSNEFA